MPCTCSPHCTIYPECRPVTRYTIITFFTFQEVILACLILRALLSVARYERLKGQVTSSETAKALEAHEQKIRHYEQSIFAMRECTFHMSLCFVGICRVMTPFIMLQSLRPRAASRSSCPCVRSAARLWTT